MNFQPVYTYRSNYSASERNTNADARNNNRLGHSRGNQQKTNAFNSQNSTLLLALQQLIQVLLQQLQEKPGNPPEDTPQNLGLTDEQRQRIATTLGVDPDSIEIEDQDGGGKVSAGDQVTATYTTDTGSQETLSQTIDADFAADINGELANRLDIDQDAAASIANQLGLPASRVPAEIFDQDMSGSLSAGDVIKSVSYDPGGQGMPSYHTISPGDIQALRDTGLYPGGGNQPSVTGQPLSLSQQQLANIDAGVGFANPDFVTILDQDASGNVSAGDVFKAPKTPASSSIPSEFNEHTLTEDEAALINGEFGSPLQLNDEDRQRVWTALNTPAERFDVVFDRDGSGTLSTGDVVLGSINGAFGGTPPPQFPTSYVTLEVAADGEVSRKNEN